jgi:hypothetical protein
MNIIPYKSFLLERASHTDIADVNELLLGYYLADEKWSMFEDSSYAQTQFQTKSAKLTPAQIEEQDDRARRMATEVKRWASANGYKGNIARVYWTARKGSLQKAVGNTGKVDPGNPTDILLQFTSGMFLGLSAKSTLGESDIGFKNPGMGTIEKLLRIDLGTIKKTYEDKFAEKHNLSKSSSVRKKEIRANTSLVSDANTQRTALMNEMRNVLLAKLNTLSDADAREHIMNAWLDAGNIIYPLYIKVTGTKTRVLIENPLQNPKMEALSKGNIKFSSVGNDSVGVMASGKKILKMRFKYESQALASSMKMSGDPW